MPYWACEYTVILPVAVKYPVLGVLMMDNIDDNKEKTHTRFVLTRKDKFNAVAMGKEDYELLSCWAEKHGYARTVMLHELIRDGIHCQQEEHLKYLTEYGRILGKLVSSVRDHYSEIE